MPVDQDFGWLAEQGEDASLLFRAQSCFDLFRPRPEVRGPEVVGLAVSGGSDSMAMLHLMARAAPHAGWRIRAVTVDHRLRSEAAEEAAFVARVCGGLGVPHDTLVWQDHPGTGNLMQIAARARYALMADWARGHGIGHIAVAHTADDQAETFLMGLSRGSGLEGLAGMRREWDEGGIRFHRPLLAASRDELRACLARNGQDWRDDPSNDNDRYTRVKARRVLKALAPLGITADRLNATIHNLHMALGVVQGATAEAFRRIGQEGAGAIALDRAEFGRLGPELARRLLVAAIRWLSGADHPPRAEAVFRVGLAIRAGRDTTLGGCRIRVTDDWVRLMREPKAVAGLSSPTTAAWDTRWHLHGPHAPGLEIRALGAAGLRQCPDWRATGLWRDAAVVTPAVWQGDVLVAAPLAGLSNGFSAETRPSFTASLLAH